MMQTQTHLTREQAQEAEALVGKVRRVFSGHDPSIVGAALAELTATLFVGIHPDMRDELLNVHEQCTRDLIPILEQQFRANGLRLNWSKSQ